MAGEGDPPIAPSVPGEGERSPPPTGGVPPRPGSADVVGPEVGPRRRSARFLPRPSPEETGGVRPSPVGAPSQRQAPATSSGSDDTHFGMGPPTGRGDGTGSSVPRVGGSAPRLVPEGPGGSSSQAPPGSSGIVDNSVMTAIAQVVREEVGKALKGSTPPPEQASRRQKRREIRRTLRREVDSESESSASGKSGEEDLTRHGRVTHTDRLGTRVVPGKIVVNNPLFKDVFDCETYGLVNKSLTYSNSQARTLGRRKKHVAQSFGVRSEWDGTPPLKVFQFLRKFAKACDDNDVSEAEAFFMLQDFTKEPLRSEVMNVMPSRHGGNPGEVTSYLELVNWILRLHADEASLAVQVEEFNRATQSKGEEEREFAERLRQLNVLCGFLYPQGVIKGRFVEGVHRAARATVRERNTPTMTLAELARIAQTKGDEYRWLVSEQRKEREKEVKGMEASRFRRTARVPSYTRTYPAVPSSSTRETEGMVAAIPDKSQGKAGPSASMSDRPCWQCSKSGHWAAQCPTLDVRLRALLARIGKLGIPRTDSDTRPHTTRVTAMTQPQSENESTLEKGENSSPSSSGKDTPSSESDEGNA